MKEILSPSLLPYLQADGNQFGLEISLISREPSFLEKNPYPFLLIDASTPFERLLEARVVSGGGYEIRRVFILQQSDDYRHTADEMWPLTNPDIDQRWETALNRFSAQKTGIPGAPIFLSNPIRETGAYVPFQPLFYCSFKNVYFHPPCPECGNLLDLCRNDRLLTESGLAAYSTSLRRYLHCPACCRESESVQFYTYARHGDDPPDLKDRWDLINDFGKLILKSDDPAGFPCSGCPELSGCYGSDNRFMSRIVPFSFYPFQMLIFEADTLSAPDFLALISGATVETLKSNLSGEQTVGRRHCLQRYEQMPESPSGELFSRDDKKRFLEILYLKLSFLGELVNLFYSDSNQGVYCDAALSLDRVWVRIADQAGRLPQYWNFTLSVIDLWSDTIRQPHLSKYPPAYGHHFLGNIWFYALLVNQRQSMQTVRAELDKQVTALGGPDQHLAEMIPIDVDGSAFAPQNIYWSPESIQVAADLRVFWKRALTLGSGLLTAGLQAGHNWSADEFWSQFNDLRSEIKAALFGPELVLAGTSAENQVIVTILNRLLDRWRRELKPTPPPEPGEEADTIILNGGQQSEDLTKTLILTTDPAPQAPLSAERQTDEEETLVLSTGSELQPPKPDIESEPIEDEPLQETLILSPEDRIKQPDTDGDAMNAEPLQETVILAPKPGPMPPTSEATPSDEDLIQETVILSPGSPPPKRAQADRPASDSGAADLAETVVLSPKGQRPGRSESPDAEAVDGNQDENLPESDRKDIRLKIGPKKVQGSQPDDDILTETVILRPQKKKGS